MENPWKTPHELLVLPWEKIMENPWVFQGKSMGIPCKTPQELLRLILVLPWKKLIPNFGMGKYNPNLGDMEKFIPSFKGKWIPNLFIPSSNLGGMGKTDPKFWDGKTSPHFYSQHSQLPFSFSHPKPLSW